MDVILGADSLLAPLTGVGNYTAAVLRGLRTNPQIRSVRCFADQQWLEDPLAAPGSTRHRASNFTARARRAAIGMAHRLARAVPGSRSALQRQRERIDAWFLDRSGAALYHEPNFALRPFDGPTIATIHDLSIYLHPDYHPPERVEYMTRHLPDTFARATRLITVSETVRQEVIDRLGLPPERVVTIHNGVRSEYHPRDPAALQAVLAQYGLFPGNYLLAVGTLEPRKNFDGLLDAFMALPVLTRRRYPLILAGGRGWHNEKLAQRLKGLATSGPVRALGYVPAEALPALYAGARGFAFPSFYEGFGLPVLEAAASGVPVLSSAATAMAEVLGGEGVLVDPRDGAALGEGLRRLLDDETLQTRARLVAPGFSSRFTWDRCVERTVALYRSVVL